LLVELLQGRTPFGAHVGQAGRDGEAARTGRLALTRPLLDLCTFALDARALLRRIVCGCDHPHTEASKHQRQRSERRGSGSAGPLALPP
jgi:hypothetical protein